MGGDGGTPRQGSAGGHLPPRLPPAPGTAWPSQSCRGDPTYLPEWVFVDPGLPHGDWLQGSKPQQPPLCLAVGTEDLGSPPGSAP